MKERKKHDIWYFIDTVSTINNCIMDYKLTNKGIVYKDYEANKEYIAMPPIPMKFFDAWKWDSDYLTVRHENL